MVQHTDIVPYRLNCPKGASVKSDKKYILCSFFSLFFWLPLQTGLGILVASLERGSQPEEGRQAMEKQVKYKQAMDNQVRNTDRPWRNR